MSDPTDIAFLPPTSLDRGRYVVARVLGTGGTATVLLARDTRMNVDRAIKVLHPQFANAGSTRTRFMHEAQAQAQLKHPNVLMVHDVVDDEQGVYMVMELAEGGALGARILSEGCFHARETADIGIHIGEALAVAHAAGLVHRDIKPANILADRHGVLKLADFGIAQVKNTDHTLTSSGSIMGTWAFMPPEQREDSSEVDQRSDIYAFGVTLYALLTGRGTSRLHNREAWSEAYAGVPPGLAQVIQTATRLFPEDRYPAIGEMVAELRAWRASPEGAGEGWAEVAEPLPIAPRSPDSATRPIQVGAPPLSGVPTVLSGSSDTTSAVPDLPPSETPAGAPAAPPTSSEGLPWVALAGIAGGGMVVAAMLGVIIVLLVDRGGPDPTPEPPPTADAPIIDPVQAAPEAPAVAPEPAPATTAPTTDPPPKPAAAEPIPKRRVIKVIAPKAAPATPAARSETDQPDETGRLVVRTIPSGARVQVGGRTPARDGGAYVLPIGTHTVVLESATGERHSVPVTVRTGQRVDICYSFDTNSSCGGNP